MNDRSRPKAAPATGPTTNLVAANPTTWLRLRSGSRVSRLERRVWRLEVRVDALEERLADREVKP